MNSEAQAPVYVLDASAFLAALLEEDGGDFVSSAIPSSIISSVNWSEVVQRASAKNLDVTGLREDFETEGLQIIPFTAEDAEQAAHLWPVTSQLGLSLADRACLSLAQKLGLSVLTADRIWSQVSLDIAIQIIR